MKSKLDHLCTVKILKLQGGNVHFYKCVCSPIDYFLFMTMLTLPYFANVKLTDETLLF